ncbi:helix-turn-helix domain-containing protein [Sphingobium yanoikuyae]|uniref:XRE family transcriptional regulator n=1 Tax=Sphingobium yanoikuyae TaxID=13690 RepID=A0A3G2V025_SPHYA|nr:XRE family transcriptional regulator [Sphingobium yanoikuyae]
MPPYETRVLRKLSQCVILSVMLKSYLEAENQTQAEFAERVRTTPATISRLISGTLRPGLDLALAIDEATGGRVPASTWRSSRLDVTQ